MRSQSVRHGMPPTQIPVRPRVRAHGCEARTAGVSLGTPIGRTPRRPGSAAALRGASRTRADPRRRRSPNALSCRVVPPADVGAGTVAWITAAGVVAGALLGAMAAGGVTRFLDTRQEKKLAQTGARLVRRDLFVAARNIRKVEVNHFWWDYYELPTRAWSRYEGAITARIERDGLERVAQTMIDLSEMSRKVDVIQARERTSVLSSGKSDLASELSVAATGGFFGSPLGARILRWLESQWGEPSGELSRRLRGSRWKLAKAAATLPGTIVRFDDPSEWKTLRESVTGAYNELAGLAKEGQLPAGLLLCDETKSPAPDASSDSTSTTAPSYLMADAPPTQATS